MFIDGVGDAMLQIYRRITMGISLIGETDVCVEFQMPKYFCFGIMNLETHKAMNSSLLSLCFEINCSLKNYFTFSRTFVSSHLLNKNMLLRRTTTIKNVYSPREMRGFLKTSKGAKKKSLTTIQFVVYTN